MKVARAGGQAAEPRRHVNRLTSASLCPTANRRPLRSTVNPQEERGRAQNPSANPELRRGSLAP